MKKRIFLLMTLIAVLLPCAFAATVPPRNIILLTEYQQAGWGDTFQLGVVDSEGKLWTYADSSRGDIPYDMNDLLAWAKSTDKLKLRATLSRTDLRDLVSLVQTVPEQKVTYRCGACDAGMQTGIAVRKDKNGGTLIIVLGASGDSVYENTDPAAQSLYRTLRTLFPEIIAYDGDASMAPAGFQKTDLLAFCGYEGIDLTKLTMTAYVNDCETGPFQINPSLSAAEIMRMTVTGKQNSMAVTGNTVICCFRDEDGSTVASFEFYGGMLVRPDGMYSIENH